jgi:putative glutathione S-transferase
MTLLTTHSVSTRVPTQPPVAFRSTIERGGRFDAEAGWSIDGFFNDILRRMKLIDRYRLYVSLACREDNLQSFNLNHSPTYSSLGYQSIDRPKLEGTLKKSFVSCFSFAANRSISLRVLPAVTVVSPRMGPRGWPFASADEYPGAEIDPLYGSQYIKDLYLRAGPEYSGRCVHVCPDRRGGVKSFARFSVPVLWDKKTETVVNNESSDIQHCIQPLAPCRKSGC